jgi:hypothetical protein
MLGVLLGHWLALRPAGAARPAVHKQYAEQNENDLRDLA